MYLSEQCDHGNRVEEVVPKVNYKEELRPSPQEECGILLITSDLGRFGYLGRYGSYCF